MSVKRVRVVMGSLVRLMRADQLEGLLRQPQVVQLLVLGVIGRRQTAVSAIQYQLSSLRGGKEAQDGLLALIALRIRALLLITPYLDSGCQVLSHKGARGAEKDADQGKNCASSDSVHVVHRAGWVACE